MHWTVDLLIIDFKTFIAFLYFEFIGPFLYPYYAHFLIHNWVELIGWPFACSNIRLGFAPFSRATKDVSKSYCWRLKNKVWLKFCVVMAFIFCVNIRNFINWTLLNIGFEYNLENNKLIIFTSSTKKSICFNLWTKWQI